MTTQFPETFDPETQEGNSWELLPVDEYVAQVVEASVQQPNSGDGYYLALTWKIIEGDFEGRQVWQRITFLHSSEQAQTIGRKTLKDLCVAARRCRAGRRRRGFPVQAGAHSASASRRTSKEFTRTKTRISPHPAAGSEAGGTGTADQAGSHGD